MKNREMYYDQLRALAIISIICCHVCCDFIILNPAIMTHFKTFYLISFFTLGRFVGIPIFVMLSGALLINKHYSLSEYVKKRFNRVFVPYIFWTIIFILFTLLVYKKELTSELLFSIILGHHGTIGVILWFVWMIMVVYIAIFIINKVLDFGKSKYEHFESRFINILALLSLMTYILVNLGILPYSGDLGYYMLFIPYAILGYWLTHTDFKVNSRYIVVITALISTIGYLYFTFSVDVASISLNEFTAGSYFQFIVMIITFCIILFFRHLPKDNRLSEKPFSSLIYSLSKCSFGIYFIHYLILKFIQHMYLKQVHFSDHPLFWTPILLFVVFISSWALIVVISKIPIINRLSGSV